MKRVLLSFFIICMTAGFAVAQSKVPAVDKSPMDMSYYPAGYPVLKISDKVTEPLAARVIYSRPQKNSRNVFGELLEYGKVWRMGANEATEIEFYLPATINKVKIKKGKYTLYCIPYADKWTIILNKELDTWGSFRYDAKKDVVRMDVPVQKQTDITESFAMYFEKTTAGVGLNIAWDDVKVVLPVTF